MPDIPGNISTTSVITVGGSLSDTLEVIGREHLLQAAVEAAERR